MNITLNDKLSRLIETEVNAGRFATAEDVITAGVTRVLAESELAADELSDLRIDAEVGEGQADRGEFIDFTAKDIIAEGRAILGKRMV
jgi:Arc/MetJ-type ribon-helix-helix transcriptional regulator